MTTPMRMPPSRIEDIHADQEQDAQEDHHRCRNGCKEARTVDLDEKQYSADKNEQPSEGNPFQKYHDHMFFVSHLKILWEKSGLNIKATGFPEKMRTGTRKILWISFPQYGDFRISTEGSTREPVRFGD